MIALLGLNYLATLGDVLVAVALCFMLNVLLCLVVVRSAVR